MPLVDERRRRRRVLCGCHSDVTCKDRNLVYSSTYTCLAVCMCVSAVEAVLFFFLTYFSFLFFFPFPTAVKSTEKINGKNYDTALVILSAVIECWQRLNYLVQLLRSVVFPADTGVFHICKYAKTASYRGQRRCDEGQGHHANPRV